MPLIPYTPEQKNYFADYLRAVRGNVKKAATWCNIDIGTAKFWAAEIKARREQALWSDDDEAEWYDDEAEADPYGGRKRPQPPPHLLRTEIDEETGLPPAPDWVPDPRAAQWLMDTWINDEGPLLDEELWFLRLARIGFLWTNAEHPRACAQAVIPRPEGERWKKNREEHQWRQWFGEIPDCVVIFSAPICAAMDDREFCSTGHHELLHFGICKNKDGEPKFNDLGRPLLRMHPHGVEEFTRCLDWYGVEAAAGDTAAFIEASKTRAKITDEQIEAACGPGDTDGHDYLSPDD